MPPTVLYLAPTFLSYRLHKQIRGVEVFDLAFAPELAREGLRVVVPADASWKQRLTERFADAPWSLEVVYTPPLRKPLWNTLAAAAMLRREQFSVAFLGNVARGMLPGVELMRRRGLWSRIVVQANRAPREAFLNAARRWHAQIVAVSADIASYFPADLDPPVQVYYGVTGSEVFRPRSLPRGDSKVRFCMLGKLDTPLKNVPAVVETFASLPADVRAASELHLIAYPRVPEAGSLPAGVVAYPWQRAEAVSGLLAEMDVLVIASDSETFSLATVQAMLCGLPVISRDLPPLREKLADGAGLLFANNEELGAAMVRLVRDPAARRAAATTARRVALERYVWNTRHFVNTYLLPAG